VSARSKQRCWPTLTRGVLGTTFWKPTLPWLGVQELMGVAGQCRWRWELSG
jgi:hypothetical protein